MISKKFPDGHFYSTIPSEKELESYSPAGFEKIIESNSIDYNIDKQLANLHDLINVESEFPFPKDKSKGFRYYYDNPFFNISDGFFYSAFLKAFKPKKIIEVGSGFSSALLLDTIDRDTDYNPQVTFIEPYNERLLSLLRMNDVENCKIEKSFVQSTKIEEFQKLEDGDLLFIDSSHVSKFGSDLNFILFNVLPNLNEGVFVHFHDIFDNFEYPQHWLKEGRFWNENYLLRSFLSFNNIWSIEIFARFIHKRFNEVISNETPFLLCHPGGSLYIRRNTQQPQDPVHIK